MRSRYAEASDARFGLIASSRDKDLGALGIGNDYMTTQRIRVGPWFGDGEGSGRSCRGLEHCATEFRVEGLELDMALLAWGADLIRENGEWTCRKARNYSPRGRTRPSDSLQMRLNAYRVLLPRGRDGTIVFVPQLPKLDETWLFLFGAGIREFIGSDDG